MRQPDYNRYKFWMLEDNGRTYDHYFKIIDDDRVLVVSFGRRKEQGASKLIVEPNIRFIKKITFITSWNYYSTLFNGHKCKPIREKDFKKAVRNFNNLKQIT